MGTAGLSVPHQERDETHNNHDERAPVPVLKRRELLVELGVQGTNFLSHSNKRAAILHLVPADRQPTAGGPPSGF